MAALQGFASLLGRVLLAAIFLGSAAMNHIPNFNGIVQYMAKEGVPMPTASHVVAIIIMLVGGILLILGYYARFGATLLLIFLILAAYFFHDFWTLEGQAAQEQQIHFMKNVAMMGGMLIVIANGPGAWSIDGRARKPAPADQAVG
jgi:putative oxidoreductase